MNRFSTKPTLSHRTTSVIAAINPWIAAAVVIMAGAAVFFWGVILEHEGEIALLRTGGHAALLQYRAEVALVEASWRDIITYFVRGQATSFGASQKFVGMWIVYFVAPVGSVIVWAIRRSAAKRRPNLSHPRMGTHP